MTPLERFANDQEYVNGKFNIVSDLEKYADHIGGGGELHRESAVHLLHRAADVITHLGRNFLHAQGVRQG